MKRALFLSTSLLLLTACSQGTSDVSSRTPKGNPNAAVVVTVFSDMQCPACRSAHFSVEDPLMEKYGNQIRFDFMHFPLRSIHRFALLAAEASECAADQGQFWEYVNTVFENQQQMTADSFAAWARQLGLDVDAFEQCVDSGKKRDTVLADYKEGRDLGVGGTPTYFVNGKPVQTGFDTIGAAIDSELERLTQRL